MIISCHLFSLPETYDKGKSVFVTSGFSVWCTKFRTYIQLIYQKGLFRCHCIYYIKLTHIIPKPNNRIKATSRSVFLRSENVPVFFMHKNDSYYLPPLAPRAVPALNIYFPAILSLQNTWEQCAFFQGVMFFCLFPLSHSPPSFLPAGKEYISSSRARVRERPCRNNSPV